MPISSTSRPLLDGKDKRSGAGPAEPYEKRLRGGGELQTSPRRAAADESKLPAGAASVADRQECSEAATCVSFSGAHESLRHHTDGQSAIESCRNAAVASRGDKLNGEDAEVERGALGCIGVAIYTIAAASKPKATFSEPRSTAGHWHGHGHDRGCDLESQNLVAQDSQRLCDKSQIAATEDIAAASDPFICDDFDSRSEFGVDSDGRKLSPEGGVQVAEICHLSVLESVRRRGVARALLRHALGYVREAGGVSEVRLSLLQAGDSEGVAQREGVGAGIGLGVGVGTGVDTGIGLEKGELEVLEGKKRESAAQQLYSQEGFHVESVTVLPEGCKLCRMKMVL